MRQLRIEIDNMETEKVKTPLGFAELKTRADPPLRPRPDLPPWPPDPPLIHHLEQDYTQCLSFMTQMYKQTIEGQIKMKPVTDQIKLKIIAEADDPNSDKERGGERSCPSEVTSYWQVLIIMD